MDPGAHRVTLGGNGIDLRPREYDLLWRLATDAGTVLPRDVLMRDVWGTGWFGSPKTLDVHINALRRKLGDPPGAPKRIVTVRGVGYRLEAG
jgi:DNA-binding response OmpR family regulator